MGEKQKEEEARGNWGGQVEFILTCIGYSVGLGNVWRFPYLAYKNGGGAFLIPYWIMMATIGLPLFFMELSLGQFSSRGPLAAWTISPLFKGVGMAALMVSGVIGFYYNVIIAYCLYFLVLSMRAEPLWKCCGNEWNTDACIDACAEDFVGNTTTPVMSNVTTVMSTVSTMMTTSNITLNKTESASSQFFYRYILNSSGDVAQMGGLKWQLVVALLVAWVIVFLVLIKGIQSLGKVVYFTAIFPYFLLTAMLIRGLTLEGHQKGLDYYLTPVWSRLGDGQVWSDACVQLFYSIGVSSGGLLTMASYNRFKNNVVRDAFIVPLVDCFTSFYSGLVIFSVLGVMAHESGKDVADVVEGGPGLTFVVYPEALTKMPAPTVWACLFFLMMCIIGFSSQFSMMETVISALMDDYSILRRHSIKFRAGICITWFLLGLPMCAEGGYALLDIVNNYIGGFPLLFVALFEVIAIMYIYGFTNFSKDIEMMLGNSMFRYFKPFFAVCWCFLSPLILLTVIVFSAMNYEAGSDNPGVMALSWMIALGPILMIPGWFLYKFCTEGGWDVLKKALKPNADWGPRLEEYRAEDPLRYEPLEPFTDLEAKNGPGDLEENNGHVKSHDNEAFEVAEERF